MKRFALTIFVTMMALSTVASAEALIFTLGSGGTLAFTPGGALTATNIPVTLASSSTGFSANCATCKLNFTTGAGTVDTTSAPVLFLYSFAANPSGSAYTITGAFGASGSLGSSGYVASKLSATTYLYAQNGAPSASEAPFISGSDFYNLLVALHLPTGSPYVGTLTLNAKNSGVPTLSGVNEGHFSISSAGGTLELDTVPETSTWISLAGGLIALGVLRRRSVRA